MEFELEDSWRSADGSDRRLVRAGEGRSSVGVAVRGMWKSRLGAGMFAAWGADERARQRRSDDEERSVQRNEGNRSRQKVRQKSK